MTDLAGILHLKIYLSVKTDLNALWTQIKSYHGTHLGSAGQDYAVYFNGSKSDGLEVLRSCMSSSTVGKFYADFGE